ncbi:MAG: hypothetical protein JXL84_26810 [Deltaproteobacteria bacterium]|nr:hypothetical protein [Deltaproteobacteria bacterium]
MNIAAVHNGEVWDLVGWVELEVAQKRNKAGPHFNEFVLPKYRRYYPFPAALWAEECFEPFLRWTETHFKANMWLCLLAYDGGTEARIVDDPMLELLRKNKHFVEAVPILA